MAALGSPLYGSRSSIFSNVTPTTGPRTGPFVLGDHPAEASVNVCSVGTISRPVDGPRVQLFAIVQSSRCTFERPADLNCSAVQWLAWSSFAEPVRRGPICSVRYVRFAFKAGASDLTFSTIFVSTSAIGSAFDAA